MGVFASHIPAQLGPMNTVPFCLALSTIRCYSSLLPFSLKPAVMQMIALVFISNS
jgi:hypothetical protein